MSNDKQRKIETLMALINGKIKPSEIPPSFLLIISPEGVSTFSINGKSVDEKTFHKRLETQPAICNFKTIGREDDNAEYYY